MAFDVMRPPFNDIRVRRAFAFAADRKTLVDVATGGYQFPATGGFVPPGMPGHSSEIGLPYDAEHARRLLAEAGYPHGRSFPIVTLRHHRYSIMTRISDYLLGQWFENLGVRVSREIVDVGRIHESLDGETPHLWLAGTAADYPDPNDFLTARSVGQTGWRNGVYDKLVDEAGRASDQMQRMSLCKEADRILIEDAPIVPLFYGRFHLLLKPWVRSFPVSPQGTHHLKDVIIEPH
jgi:oligopeptide transport system substrate-binding protein